MKWTLKVDRVVERAGFQIAETPQGLVLRAKTDPHALFSASPLHILTMYVCCAMVGASVEADTFLAACDLARGLESVDPVRIANGVQAILMSEYPETAAPLAASGGLAHVEIGEPRSCLGPLRAVPSEPHARWWAFLRLCGADVQRAARTLRMDEQFCRTLTVYETLYSSAAPRDLLSLKVRLGRLPKFDFDAAARTFAVFAPEWEDAPGLYRRLKESGQPYRISQLAVTIPELTAAGVPGRRMNNVLSQLLAAVQRTPELNTPAALLALARTLCG